MNIGAAQTRLAGTAGVGDYVLLTGATGFLGTEIMRRILRHHPRSRLALLVRSNTRETARERTDRMLVRIFGQEEASRHRERLDVVEGDIAHKGLSIDSDRSAALRSHVDHVIHCAAAIRFDLPLDIARRDNTEGTRNVLSFVEHLEHLGRFDYIGTAFVAGEREGLVKENELDEGQTFRNSYERTKMEAEKLVREFAERRPTAIYRPSIVVGDSRTGETASFQGFYQVLLYYRKFYSRGLTLIVPADPNAPIDIVPVDYVVDALFALMHKSESIGRVFHLTSGPSNTCTFDELMNMTAKFTGINAPFYVPRDAWRRVVRPLLLALVWGKKRELGRKGEVYLPYLWMKLVFDKTNTDALLEGTGITTPHARLYFVKLLEYQARALRLGKPTNG
jgi:thioester reductase-like protein